MKNILNFLLSLTIFAVIVCKPQFGKSKESQITNFEPDSILFVNSQGGLRMREEPNTESSILMMIPNGAQVYFIEQDSEIVEIKGKYGNWVKVSFEGNEGWVFGGFLKEEVGFGK